MLNMFLNKAAELSCHLGLTEHCKETAKKVVADCGNDLLCHANEYLPTIRAALPSAADAAMVAVPTALAAGYGYLAYHGHTKNIDSTCSQLMKTFYEYMDAPEKSSPISFDPFLECVIYAGKNLAVGGFFATAAAGMLTVAAIQDTYECANSKPERVGSPKN